MAVDIEEKLQKRKLDALKRGVHRTRSGAATPLSIHLVGVGGAGCDIVAQALGELPESHFADPRVRFSALAIDIGDEAVARVRDRVSRLPAGRTCVEGVSIDVPAASELQATLARHREFLQLEYPLSSWDPSYQPWLSADAVLPAAGARFPRAVSKALYSRGYYDGTRPIAAALRRLAQSVEASAVDSVVCIVFGLAGGSGSGIAVDLARHLSNVILGRRVVVVGIGIAPCEGDDPAHRGAQLFPSLTELDCLSDHEKNRGVTVAFGDLHSHPFTGGFLVVPQQHVWEATKDLAATHRFVDGELASFLTGQGGTPLWETLKLLNWVAAPSTQHSAARTPFGAQWIHLWACWDLAGKATAPELTSAQQLGVRASYRPEFIEVRAADAGDERVGQLAAELEAAFKPVAPVEMAAGASAGSAHFVLPCLDKTDLDAFFAARAAYDAASEEEKRLGHAWLVDLGVLLCEPGTRIPGTAGASLWGDERWVAIPYTAVRGDEPSPPVEPPAARSVEPAKPASKAKGRKATGAKSTEP